MRTHAQETVDALSSLSAMPVVPEDELHLLKVGGPICCEGVAVHEDWFGAGKGVWRRPGEGT